MRNVILFCFLGLSLSAKAQLSKLEKLKGTWLIIVADTAKNGTIHQDSILTKLAWSADGKSLSGEQRIKTAAGVSYGQVSYTYDSSNDQFSYSENGEKGSPLIIHGDTWIYPAGNYRTLNTFNKTGNQIIYEVQKLTGNKWITTKTGKENKLE